MRNIGSQVSRRHEAYAKNTALGHNTPSTSKPRPSETVVKQGGGRPKGSWEGYMHAVPAHIQLNGAGYDNKMHQRARGLKAPADFGPNVSQNPHGHISVKRNMFDYRYMGNPGNSAHRLRAVMALNKMF